MPIEVKGAVDITRSLNRQLMAMKTRTAAGLLAGGLIIQREAQKRAPVEYGNLRGSAYTRKAQAGGLSVEVGFTSSYAVFVHENLAMKWQGRTRRSGKGVYWGPQGEARFLANAVTSQSSTVLRTVAAYAKVKA